MKDDERGDRVPADRETPASVRLDVWLDVACLFRTRSEAQRACRGGKVHVNGQAAKPHREIRVGDALEITRPLGRRQQVVIRGLAERHLLKAWPTSCTRTDAAPVAGGGGAATPDAAGAGVRGAGLRGRARPAPAPRAAADAGETLSW